MAGDVESLHFGTIVVGNPTATPALDRATPSDYRSTKSAPLQRERRQQPGHSNTRRAVDGRRRGRTTGIDARLLRRKALRLRSAATLDETKVASHVPIHAVRLQPLVLQSGRSSTDQADAQFGASVQTVGRSRTNYSIRAHSYRSHTGSTRGTYSENHDTTASTHVEGRMAEAVVPKTELEAYRYLWQRSRKKFWLELSAQLPPQLGMTLRQALESCVKATERDGGCDLNLCNRGLGDEGTDVLGLVLGMGDM